MKWLTVIFCCFAVVGVHAQLQGKQYDQRISKYNASLEVRKQTLYNKYAEYQAQLVELGNAATMFGIDLGSNVNTSG